MANCKACESPFFHIEVFPNGDVFTCCCDYIKWSIGNIFENTFEEVWNSKKAQLIRRYVLQGQYNKCCNTDLCSWTQPSDNSEYGSGEFKYFKTNVELKEIMPLPKIVKFCHDVECNVRCIFCRKNLICNSKEETELLNSRIDTIYLPMLKNAEVVVLNGSGDVLGSRHGRTMIKRIAEVYPNIKFIIHTNGLLANEKMLKELGIIDRLVAIELSIHAAKKETYNKLVVGSDWDTVMKNLEFLSNLKNKGTLKDIYMFFVVNSLNYKEIPDFIQLAKKFNAECSFWNYRHTGAKGKKTHTKKQYNELACFEKNNPRYADLINVLHNPICDDKIATFNPMLLEIKKQPLQKITFINKIRMLKEPDYKLKYAKDHKIKYKILKFVDKKTEKLYKHFHKIKEVYED